MLVTRLVRLSGYLLLTLGLLPALVLLFEQVVWASENAAALSSPRTAWKEVDLAYDRLFPYDRSRQPHPPAGCVVLPAISHNIYKQGAGITPPAILILRCRERIELLRPARWVRSRLRAQNRQGYLLVSMPEMGIMDVHVHVIAVKSSAFNPAIVKIKSASSRPVIGLFIHHAMNVRQYTFEDTLTGKLERIKATPNHPFYVVNQQHYIQVSRLSAHDQLINVLGHPVTVVCPKGKTSHCGQPYHPGQVIPVYNLEVYGQHRYFVGKAGIMVHNGYKDKDNQCGTCQKRFGTPAQLRRHLITHTDDKPFVCRLCGKRYNNTGSLTNHFKGSHSGERPYGCPLCDMDFALKAHLKQHFRSKTHMDAAAEAARKMNIDTLTPADVSSAASAPSKETKQMEERARSRSPIMPIQELAQFYGDYAKEL